MKKNVDLRFPTLFVCGIWLYTHPLESVMCIDAENSHGSSTRSVRDLQGGFHGAFVTINSSSQIPFLFHCFALWEDKKKHNNIECVFPREFICVVCCTYDEEDFAEREWDAIDEKFTQFYFQVSLNFPS